MKFIKIWFVLGILFLGLGCRETQTIIQKKSLIVLGDMHFDLMEDHDMVWLKSKPDDFRQVTEYTVFTKLNFNKLINEVLLLTKQYEPAIQAVIQLGDLQEGLAGTPELARNMTIHTRDALRSKEFSIPWILVKGNHDITGPGAEEAFQDVMIPFIQEQLNIPISKASYTYDIGNIKVISMDCYDTDGLLEFLDQELSESTAKYNIIATHQPIIPITGRCWHVFNRPEQSEKRKRLLSLIARYKALVISAHMHRYSVLRRETNEGPVVQLSTISVIREADRHEPYWYHDEYGSSLIDLEPNFNPETKDQRKKILDNEAKFVTNFRLADMPGYNILDFDDSKESICVKVYCGLENNLVEEVNLSNLMK